MAICFPDPIRMGFNESSLLPALTKINFLQRGADLGARATTSRSRTIDLPIIRPIYADIK